jgi:hypothetical protein
MKNYYIFLSYNHYLCPQVRFYHIENILSHLNGLMMYGISLKSGCRLTLCHQLMPVLTFLSRYGNTHL